MNEKGVTNTGCFPYMQGGGDWADHFSSDGDEIAMCRDTCVDAYPGPYLLINAKDEVHDQGFTFDTFPHSLLPQP